MSSQQQFLDIIQQFLDVCQQFLDYQSTILNISQQFLDIIQQFLDIKSTIFRLSSQQLWMLTTLASQQSLTTNELGQDFSSTKHGYFGSMIHDDHILMGYRV